VDTAAGSVDETPGIASTRAPLCSERRAILRIVPAGSHDILALATALQIETDDLAGRIAEALRDHEEKLLSELAARIARKLKATPDTSAGIGLSDEPEIMGIEPHGLYPVSFVADRWDVSEDNVRKKPQVELPRSGWKGGEIRYRGIDILRYEGVEVEEHIDEPSSRLEGERADLSSEAGQSNGHSSPATTQTGNGRPYNSELPPLSDEDSTAD
jgi:hypothetical protein